MTDTPNRHEEQAVALIRAAGGTVSTSQALRAGIHPRTLYRLRDTGRLLRLRRGLFRLADAEPLAEPDLVAVATRCPRAVICLLSALAFHDLTDAIPHAVAIALPAGTRRPALDFPPIEPHWFAPAAYEAGREHHDIDGHRMAVYSREKTIADCFKFRGQLGLDTCIEALRRYRSQGRTMPDDLLRCARICRVERTMRPHLDMLFG